MGEYHNCRDPLQRVRDPSPTLGSPFWENSRAFAWESWSAIGSRYATLKGHAQNLKCSKSQQGGSSLKRPWVRAFTDLGEPLREEETTGNPCKNRKGSSSWTSGARSTASTMVLVSTVLEPSPACQDQGLHVLQQASINPKPCPQAMKTMGGNSALPTSMLISTINPPDPCKATAPSTSR